MNKILGFAVFFTAMLLVAGCAGERQGIVCEEIEYRLNTMTYSPDQRAYMENELRTCREDEAKKILSASSVRIVADMNDGCESAVAWGCDLTYDYVKINGDYRS